MCATLNLQHCVVYMYLCMHPLHVTQQTCTYLALLAQLLDRLLVDL